MSHKEGEFWNPAVIAQMTCFSLFQYRHKAGGSNSESILVSQLQHGLALEFEHSDPLRRLRLVLSELLAIMNKVPTCLCICFCFFIHSFTSLMLCTIQSFLYLLYR